MAVQVLEGNVAAHAGAQADGGGSWDEALLLFGNGNDGEVVLEEDEAGRETQLAIEAGAALGERVDALKAAFLKTKEKKETKVSARAKYRSCLERPRVRVLATFLSRGEGGGALADVVRHT